MTFFWPRCSKIFTKIFLVVSEVGSALSTLMAKWEGTGMGTFSSLSRKKYLLVMEHGDQPWNFAYTVDVENIDHGPEITYLMSRATLFITCFFHRLCHHNVSS